MQIVVTIKYSNMTMTHNISTMNDNKIENINKILREIEKECDSIM